MVKIKNENLDNLIDFHIGNNKMNILSKLRDSRSSRLLKSYNKLMSI